MEEHDIIAEVTSKREDEQKKIEALKQRLMMIKRESEMGNKKQEDLNSLRLQLETLLQTVNSAVTNLQNTFETQKSELNILIEKLNETKEKKLNELEAQTTEGINDEVEKNMSSIESELFSIQMELENTELKADNEKLIEKNEELKLELDDYKERINLLQKQVGGSAISKTNSSTESMNEFVETSGENIEENAIEVQRKESYIQKNRIQELKQSNAALNSQKEYLLTKLRHLQRSFDSEESLCRALFGDLGAEKISNYTRAGYLVKQGGTVKSWKRRYFILKDNFLFYYKRPKDDSPTGIILLDEYSVGEFTEDSDRKNCFKIDTANRVWMLQAERQIDMDIWIESIAQAALWFDVNCNSQNNLADFISDTKPTNTVNITTPQKKSSFRLTTYLNPMTKL